MFELKNRTAIVTGAASKLGIGRATAISLARQGADVVVCDLDKAGLDETQAEIKKLGRRSLGFIVDVSKPEDVQRMVDAVEKEWGRIDILVNNAGVTKPVKVAETTVEEWERIMRINLKGVFLCSKAVAPCMAKNNFGRIINLSSVSAKRGGGVFGGAHYSASKAGVLGFSKAFAREVGSSGITVNSVAPGIVLTEIRGGIESPEEQKRISADIPMRRFGTAEEVAATICFLASEEAGYITGEDIDINGGSHMD
jgi:3-oxoacyl-[acyl-carrier protein] reductase